MELEIAQAAVTMPFIVINGICFLIAGGTAAVMCARQWAPSSAGFSPKSMMPALTPVRRAVASP